ncbi:DUF1385 domain-containing protein [Candidatus Aerophobetes bacterium]|nr:DUF1385 domain-containing protein [Candidatus Aerophobetes bacterium]
MDIDKKPSYYQVSASEDVQIGGQAVIEGVMMRSPQYVSIALRKSNGEIVVKKDAFVPLIKRYKFLNLPIIRGAITLVETLYIGIKALTYSADIAAQEDLEGEESSKEVKKEDALRSKKEKLFTTLWLSLSIALGVFLALFLFFYLPLVLTDLLRVKAGYLFNIVDGMIRISIFLVYLWLITMWKSMRRIFEYHGAEHKSIFALERGEGLTVENVKKYSTHHPRCGTSFLLIVMLVSIAIFMFVGRPHTIQERLIRLLYVPLIGGISYELIKLSGKKATNRLVRALVAPGLWLQRMTTKEPDDKQLEVAIVALKSSLEK